MAYDTVLADEGKRSVYCTGNHSYDPDECNTVVPVLCLPNEPSTPRKEESLIMTRPARAVFFERKDRSLTHFLPYYRAGCDFFLRNLKWRMTNKKTSDDCLVFLVCSCPIIFFVIGFVENSTQEHHKKQSKHRRVLFNVFLLSNYALLVVLIMSWATTTAPYSGTVGNSPWANEPSVTGTVLHVGCSKARQTPPTIRHHREHSRGSTHLRNASALVSFHTPKQPCSKSPSLTHGAVYLGLGVVVDTFSQDLLAGSLFQLTSDKSDTRPCSGLDPHLLCTWYQVSGVFAQTRSLTLSPLYKCSCEHICREHAYPLRIKPELTRKNSRIKHTGIKPPPKKQGTGGTLMAPLALNTSPQSTAMMEAFVHRTTNRT